MVRSVSSIRSGISFLLHSSPIPLLLAGLSLCIGASTLANAQATNIILNQTEVQGGSPNAFKIATLAGSGGGTYDQLHFVATIGWDWLSGAKSTFDVLCANRNGFRCVYNEMGNEWNYSSAQIAAYQNSDTSIDIYILMNSGYSVASYSVLENVQETVYTNVQDTGSTFAQDTASATLVWSTSTVPPVAFSDFNGYLGVGWNHPGSSISTAGGINVDAEDDNAGTPFPYGGYSVLGISFGTASGEGIGSARVAGSTNLYGLDFFTSFQNRLSITNGGNVGIGTNNPEMNLHIGNTNGGGIRIGAVLDSGNLNVPLGAIAAQYNLDFSGYRDAAGDQIGARIAALRFNGWQPNSALIQPTGLAFFTNPRGVNSGTTDLVERMRVLPNGNIGIATMTPAATLEVNGAAMIDGNLTVVNLTTGGITFPNGTMTSAPPSNLASSGGNLGVGTTTPASPLSVNGGASIGAAFTGAVAPTNGAAIQGFVGIGTPNPVSELTLGDPSTEPNPNNTGAQLYYDQGGLTFASSNGTTVGRVAAVQDVGYFIDRSDLTLSVGQGGGHELEVMRLQAPTGNVGIGITNPGADLPTQAGPVLETVGNIALKQGTNPGQGTGAGIIFSDGTVQTTAYVGTACTLAELVMPDKTIVAQGGDYAESVDVNGDRASYEPGDVMVIDPINPEHFLKSSKPYSTLVAGIYSTKPGYVGRRQPGDPQMAKTEIPMAMIGIVPTKVTTENGPINVGDLLVTSSHEGYAMKGTDRGALNGAIVGKALTKLDSGNGVIEVLVSLQ